MTAYPVRSATVLIVGDSISAGYGLTRPAEGWVARCAEKLQQALPGSRIANASISGDTTAGGLARLPGLLQAERPDLVILELGGNDGLQGLPFTQMQANLARMVELSRQASARVALLGMRIPPNYGPAYTQRFEGVYRAVAEQFGVPYIPFFLEDVALTRELMQADGIHPNERAQPLLCEKVWSVIRPLLPGAAKQP